MKEIFEGVEQKGSYLYTAGRRWHPEKSKLAAAIKNGLEQFPFKKGTKILYLGASTGTTSSHLSDIIGNGLIYAVEFSERVIRQLVSLAEQRNNTGRTEGSDVHQRPKVSGNIAPILADARKPEIYNWIEEVDVVYVDIADSQETEIAIRNAKGFLKKNGYLFLTVKSQSIDVTKAPEQVFREEEAKLKKAGFKILQVLNLEPYEKKHAMIVAKK
jgi:fibrillarin-like pre-rRNA processing protein